MAEQTKPTAKPAAQPAATPKAEKAAKPQTAWGLTELEVLAALAGKPVVLTLTSGRELRGALVGYDNYFVTVKTADAVVLAHKGSLETVRAA